MGVDDVTDSSHKKKFTGPAARATFDRRAIHLGETFPRDSPPGSFRVCPLKSARFRIQEFTAG